MLKMRYANKFESICEMEKKKKQNFEIEMTKIDTRRKRNSE